MEGTRKELIIEGLDCAHCAAKIEKEIKGLSGVEFASINFITKTLVVEAENETEMEAIIESIEEIVNKHEPNGIVKEKNIKRDRVKDDNGHKHGSEGNRKELNILLIGGALFFIAILFEFSFPVELILFSISYILVGGEVVLKAIKNMSRGQLFDENFLMTIATIGAFAIGEFPEGVAVMLFYQVGEFMQDLAVNRSRKSIAELMDIRPDYANLKSKEGVKRVSPESVGIGEIIIVKPGEKIPLDGEVIEGKSMVDTSALTGESVPREVSVGKEVLGGFVNTNGLLSIKVTKEFGESTVAKILYLVENASSKKAPTENFITKFARYYTPIVVFSALGLAVIPPLVLEGATFSQWFYRALIFLVISCPCALVVSIPLGFFGGIGGASKNGILVKGGNYLEALNNVEIIVMDKTGTLTKGVFKVTKIEALNSISKDELLEYAAYTESYSNHPIAASILKEYGGEIDKGQIEDYNEIAGYGIKARVKGKNIIAGNMKLMERENIPLMEVEEMGTIVHIAIDGQYVGYIVISDEIKVDSKETIRALKEIGIKQTVMLTGDNSEVAKRVGNELGLDKVYSELLPQDKIEKVEKLEKEKTSKGKIMFVGDGINDAPVLARADLGVAMGGLGSDAAIEAADIVIMNDEPSKIIIAMKIARRTRNIVWQNIIFSLGVKGVVLLLGAFGHATMWAAVFADVGVALIAVLNAMRVMMVKDI